MSSVNTPRLRKTTPATSKRGSTLTVVLIIMMLASFMAASLLTLGSHEKDFTYRRIADVEGRHVLESAVEIAMADLQQYFREAQSVTNSVPTISLSTALTNQLITNTRYVTDVRILDVTNTQYRDQVFVDARDPDTVLDPHRGSYVNISEWVIRAEADINYRGQTRQMRAAQSFQVRESPFFTHAILYNMDLEFHPGPAMIINGPVHSNGRIWALALNSLHFLDRVTATEGIHIGSMLEGQQTNWSTGPSSGQSGRKVWFNTNGRIPAQAETQTAHNRTFANLFGSGSETQAASYYDSRSEESGKLFSDLGFTAMSEFFANWFDNFLASGSVDAPIIRSQFIPNYVADDGNGNRLNFGYALIEPLMSPLDSDGSSNPFHKGNGEREKFAFKSGLTFEVRHLPDFDVSILTEDQNHWRRLWEPGYEPTPRPHYSQAFNTFEKGDLNGQSGFIVEGDSKNKNFILEIQDTDKIYSSGEVEHDISTKIVSLSKDELIAHVGFPALDAESVYFSVLVRRRSNAANNQIHIGLTNQDEFDSVSGVKIVYERDPPNGHTKIILGENLESPSHRAASGNAGDLADNNETYLLVARIYKTNPDGNYDGAELLINPSTLNKPLTGWQSVHYDDTGIKDINRFFFFGSGANSNFDISDIRIGTEYRQVVGKQPGQTDYWIIPQKVRRSNAFDLDSTDFSPSASIPLLDENGDPLKDADGNEMSDTILGVAHDPVYIHEDIFHDVFRARLYAEDDDGRPLATGGFYDKRELKPQDLVSMDMGAFKTEIVETTDLDRFRKPLEDDSTVLTYNPPNEFNGVTFFQFPLNPQTRPDNIVVARDSFREVTTKTVDSQSWVAREDTTSLSLHVHNARQIPNPSYNSTRAPGFTLAANSRMYIHGSYNADGIYSTGSPTSAEGEAADYNALAALAADSLTFLSDSFKFEHSKNSFNNLSNTAESRPVFTEVNAALMGGIVPTNTTDYDTSRYIPISNTVLSGGSHNFHRFLERWDRGSNNNNKTFRYRGSMVSFYESELSRSFMGQDRGRPQGYDWYEAPRREYGFYDVFGTGAQPPGTPMARTFFKMDFRFE
ncbi:MAG: hypothetical protein LAT79_08975 [Kiritimatiellae bacterium]|nr:hypothetical protein [Kiritimatiellia bacterium]